MGNIWHIDGGEQSMTLTTKQTGRRVLASHRTFSKVYSIGLL